MTPAWVLRGPAEASGNWVHVHVCEPDDLPLHVAWQTLDSVERSRVSRIRRATDRRHFVVAHGLLRLVLGAYSEAAPAGLRISNDAFGRPELCAGSADRLRFSLSHTNGLVGCAVTRELPIGFDLESMREPAPLHLASRFFAAAEVAELQSTPQGLRDEHFFRLWTLKEAVLKALGIGLHGRLKSFAIVGLSNGSVPLGLSSCVDSAPWLLRSWRSSRHCVGLGIRGALGALEPADVRVFSARPAHFR